MNLPSRRSTIPLGAALFAIAISTYLLRRILLTQGESSILANALAAVLPAFVFGAVTYAVQARSLVFAGPTPMPLLGNAPDLVRHGNMQKSMRFLRDSYGPVIDIILAGERALLVDDPAFCRAAFKSTDRAFVKANFRQNFRQRFLAIELWGNSDLDLFKRSSDIGEWKKRRRILQPAFDQKHARAAQPTIAAAARRLVLRLSSIADGGQPFDVLPVLAYFALDASLEILFGTSLESLPDGSDGQWIIDGTKFMAETISKYMFDPLLWLRVRPLHAMGLSPRETERREMAKRLRSFMKDLLQQEKNRQSERKGKDELSSLMSILVSWSIGSSVCGVDSVSEDERLDDESILDELGAFLFAGYDTTSTTLSILLHHLATHPLQQERVHKEIDKALEAAAVEGEVEGYDFMKILAAHPLPYLSACIRESQRLQPITPFLRRRLERPVEMKLSPDVAKRNREAAIMVPSGTKIFIPIYLLHRNESFYPHPDKYKPERWLWEDGGKCDAREGSSIIKPAPGGSFYAFGGGPKMCVGFQLAEKELKMASLAILTYFSLEAMERELDIKDEFVTGPKAVMISLTKRRDEQV